ncbi:uncharacterized protein C9orf50 [Fukomys damarensis]|uniref:uncharacterized protein C9orf50 n=1 Tax=Fukomys damarensis TaxID=885580 RepID=UPI00053FC21F|nr:uncharacterized protein C9orf50 [Fukomys damarensis]
MEMAGQACGRRGGWRWGQKWTHRCSLPAVQQSRMAPQLAESGSKPGLRRWLDSLPRAAYLGAKEDAMTSSSCWAQPGPAPCMPPRPQAWDPGCAKLTDSCLPRTAQEPQGYLYKGTPLNGSVPFVPRASAPRPWRDLQGLLDTCSFLEQVGRSSCSWSQKLEVFLPSLVLQSVPKHSYPKGYPKGY